MASFPRTEPEVIALAQTMISGLTSHNTIYPSPPYIPNDLKGYLDSYISTQSALVEAQSAAALATQRKNDAFTKLSDVMKTDLRYAEMTVDYDDTKLKQLGWGGRAARTTLTAPGQPRTLMAPNRGNTSLTLEWKEPLDGGKVQAYKVQRRERPSGAWLDVATALEPALTLADQARGIEWEYRVVAINKAGESAPSNSVQVVL